MAAGANGIMHRFYVIELSINQLDKNNPQNASLFRDDVCDNRPIFGNEFGKIYIRRNGYVRSVWGKELSNLKQVTYLKEAPIPKLEELPKTNKSANTKTNTDDEDTDFFSFDSDSM